LTYIAIVNVHFFTVFRITAGTGYSMWLHFSGYHSDRCGLQSVR